MNRRRGAFAALVGLLVVLLAGGPASEAAAESYVVVTGAGSTWSSVAIAAWASDVAANGLTVNYSATGSTDGRRQYIFGTADFAVSEIPFQLTRADNQDAEHPETRPYAYLPIVAGGTSMMYHLTVGGQRVTDLRLSGETLTKIFTGVITNWSDAQITADYGKALPDEVIKPVVRSDGSGTSAQFSLYMATQYPDLWNPFCVQYIGLPAPCGLTSFYPQFPGSTAQTGSNGVANYVAASYSEGAITYVEYAYALGLGYPVVKLLNSAGYYTSPSAGNVGVALLNAQINPDLTQNLTNVYTNPDPRTYPMSSYSYMIVPTTTAPPMTVDKGKSMSTFINYFLCGGQQKAAVLGYSPLPQNLVESAFDQVRKIPGFVPPPTDLTACNNPTFQNGVNTLLRDTPNPPDCDKVGQGPCGPGGTAPDPVAAGTDPGATAPGATTPGGTTPTNPDGTPVTPEQAAAAAAAAGVDPETGLPVSSGGTSATAAGQAVGTVQTLGAFTNSSTQTRVMYGLTAVEILLAVLIPPFLAAMLRRRRDGTPQ